MKLNEVQLKKFFLKIVNWSDKKFDEMYEGFEFSKYRKIILFNLVRELF